MTRFRSLLLGALLLSTAPALAQPAAAPRPEPLGLTSSSFADGGIIPDKNSQASTTPLSPQLGWTNAPAGTQSYTLILHDVDVAGGHNVADNLHWLAFNIPGTATSLPEGVPNTATLPDGTIQPGKRSGFQGPGAPATHVYHHYIFELYALDTKLELGTDATRDQVLAAMNGHVIGKASIFGRFHRPL